MNNPSSMHARRTNPFTPVFGKVPPHLAGRGRIIDSMVDAFASNSGDPNLSSIFVGARGTGKTALLTYLADEAQRFGWVAANVTAMPGMLDDILQRIGDAAEHLAADAPKARISSVEIAPLGSISWEHAPQPVGNWRTHMNKLFAQLDQTQTGILITVDEVDPSLDEMTQLVVTYQHFVREGKKAALLMAGLPHRVSGLLAGKSTSFLRRAARHNLNAIPRYEVEEAFRLTAEEGGRAIDDDALDTAVKAIGGFPFMFQLVGYRSWNAAGTRETISLEDVQRGARLAQEELVERVFDATFAELSAADKAFLMAMVPDEGLTARADLTKRLGKSSSHISTYKKRLLESGVIEEPRPGTFAFALPGFRDYLSNRA